MLTRVPVSARFGTTHEVLEWHCPVVLDLFSLPAGDINVTPREGSFTLPKVPGASRSVPSNGRPTGTLPRSGRPQPGPQLPPQTSASGSAWAKL